MKIAATDLDRTLLRNDGTFSEANLQALQQLKDAGFVTVIATGRNLYSACKVLTPELPIDYLIFASGCGVLHWESDTIVYKRKLGPTEISKAVKILMSHKADFMIHKEIPDNHHFYYYQNGFENKDFHDRIELYADFATSWQEKLTAAASQILAVIPHKEMQKFHLIKQELDFVKVIRTTSPLDHKTVWLEIFPSDVSKGHTLKWLCRTLNISRENSFSLGNDYNDIDMLNWTSNSYLVANAPEDLKAGFEIVPANENDGFTVWADKIKKKSE